jgi:hypothetical protein
MREPRGCGVVPTEDEEKEKGRIDEQLIRGIETWTVSARRGQQPAARVGHADCENCCGCEEGPPDFAPWMAERHGFWSRPEAREPAGDAQGSGERNGIGQRQGGMMAERHRWSAHGLKLGGSEPRSTRIPAPSRRQTY